MLDATMVGVGRDQEPARICAGLTDSSTRSGYIHFGSMCGLAMNPGQFFACGVCRLSNGKCSWGLDMYSMLFVSFVAPQKD